MGSGNDLERGHRGISHRGSPSELLPAHWKVQNWRYRERDGRSSMVHPEPDRALLFSTSKCGNTAASVSPDRVISHGIH